MSEWLSVPSSGWVLDLALWEYSRFVVRKYVAHDWSEFYPCVGFDMPLFHELLLINC